VIVFVHVIARVRGKTVIVFQTVSVKYRDDSIPQSIKAMS
jgi:hypothetical protein